VRARADVEPSIVTAPRERAVGLQMHVLDARGGIRVLVDDVGRLEAVLDVADLAVDIDVDVALGLATLPVEPGRARLHGQLRIEDGGQQLVLHLQRAAPRLRRSYAVCPDGGDPLAHEADAAV